MKASEHGLDLRVTRGKHTPSYKLLFLRLDQISLFFVLRNTYSHSATSPGMQQMHYGGMTVTRATSGGRAYSFEGENMLPTSALDDPGNPAYSPYATASPNSGFASWGGGYGGAPQPGDPYGSPTSPLQPRPTVQMGMIPPSPLPGGGMRLYGTNFAATSPGLPIQTTASNKGPDGANLFIFHIPNHYTNLDMYHLFLPFGNLLSVRIMVERETGRSRGFGFVSYDTPEAAAMAIKELNGYPVREQDELGR
jgi:RNA recognition motif. (a.k.a. RRM, RBD, or RNP domain)